MLLLFWLCVATLGSSLARGEVGRECDTSARDRDDYKAYFQGLKSVYGLEESVYKCYRDCGWPKTSFEHLPTLLIAVGLEGSGQKMWMSSIFKSMIEADPTICSADSDISAPYNLKGRRNFPLLSSEELASSIQSNFLQRNEPCRMIIDFSHSFPMGNKKSTGRTMRHGDLVNLQQLHGVLYNVKYLVLVRNVVDAAMLSLSRNTAKTLDTNLRSVESSLVYLEAVLNQIPCHQKFLAHFEKFHLDPRAFSAPLRNFININTGAFESAGRELDSSIEAFAKQKRNLPMLKIPRDLVRKECNRKDSDKKCNKELELFVVIGCNHHISYSTLTILYYLCSLSCVNETGSGLWLIRNL